jgi:mannose-1-phosphate guanylyltransferase
MLQSPLPAFPVAHFSILCSGIAAIRISTGGPLGMLEPTFNATSAKASAGWTLKYSSESSPLGTGGPLRNAVGCVRSGSCLVMNGDSYTDVDLGKFVAAHLEAKADVPVVVVPVGERADVGSVLIDPDGNVTQFAEKEHSLRAQHLNAGIYALSQEMLHGTAGAPISLERELFPLWIHEGHRIKGFVHSGKCVDIGTPERYRKAQKVLDQMEVAARSAGDEEFRA